MLRLIELEYEDKKILVEAEFQDNEVEEIGAEGQVKRIEAALGSISNIVLMCAKEVSRALKSLELEQEAPKSAAMELGVSFTGTGDAYIVQIAAEASLKITLNWEHGI